MELETSEISPIDQPLVKRCSVCKNIFPATPIYFSRDRSTKSGLHHRCKTCDSKRLSERKQKVHETNAHNCDKVQPPQSPPAQTLDVPGCCGSCGTTRGNIIGDIDKNTHKRYGYLCAVCSDIIRRSKGDSAILDGASLYLKRTRLDHNS